MKAGSVAIIIYGGSNSGRNALTEEKYRDLAHAFSEQGFAVSSVLYNDEAADTLAGELLKFDAILVWVNPVEKGKDRKILDALLTGLAAKGKFVSTHPEVILKMGTKAVLYETRDMDWGGNTKCYHSFDEFKEHFIQSLSLSGIRVLKQYRGNGGNGVFKIMYNPDERKITVIHAAEGNKETQFSADDFFKEFERFFSGNGLLIDQAWNNNIENGMVRCYLAGTRVSGFGYQEINALYHSKNNPGTGYIPAGKRYYFTENCGLFIDLKEVLENKWVQELQEKLLIKNEMMPVIWDADFFINKANSRNAAGKYTLCEINVSCVSPFPPSSIKFIVEEVEKRILAFSSPVDGTPTGTKE